MEYVKGKPYFCLNGEKIARYPYLDRDISCELLIIAVYAVKIIEDILNNQHNRLEYLFSPLRK